MPPRKAISRSLAGVGDALEVVLEVADQAADVEAGVLADQQLGGLVGDLLGDVDRDVGLEAAGVAHRAEQVAGLRRRAGAELDQGRAGAPAAATISAERSARGSPARPGSGSTRRAR